ncbi:MAG: 16S rRNA processing protein RimM [Novosphingobium sp.]|nr:16S rRNA processing protein RimM [Novosphingobium sp.]
MTGAHGVTGEIRLKLFGEGVAALKRYRTFNGGTLTLTKVRDDNKGGAIARFAEVTDRNAAEALRGTELTVPRSELPDLPEGEYYHADLIGLPVLTREGAAVGRCVAIENYGASDIIEIERADGSRFMVPMLEAAIPEWSRERILISESFIED